MATLDIGGVGGGCKDSVIRLGVRTFPVVPGKIRAKFNRETVASIEGRDVVCYAVISSLAFE